MMTTVLMPGCWERASGPPEHMILEEGALGELADLGTYQDLPTNRLEEGAQLLPLATARAGAWAGVATHCSPVRAPALLVPLT